MNFLDRKDEREVLYNRAGGVCETCKELVCFSDMELAHKIARTKSNVKRYGRAVVEHPLNKAVTHRGKCNDAQNIGFATMQADALAMRINSTVAGEPE